MKKSFLWPLVVGLFLSFFVPVAVAQEFQDALVTYEITALDLMRSIRKPLNKALQNEKISVWDPFTNVDIPEQNTSGPVRMYFQIGDETAEIYSAWAELDLEYDAAKTSFTVKLYDLSGDLKEEDLQKIAKVLQGLKISLLEDTALPDLPPKSIIFGKKKVKITFFMTREGQERYAKSRRLDFIVGVMSVVAAFVVLGYILFYTLHRRRKK